jgi:hypothetical protein
LAGAEATAWQNTKEEQHSNDMLRDQRDHLHVQQHLNQQPSYLYVPSDPGINVLFLPRSQPAPFHDHQGDCQRLQMHRGFGDLYQGPKELLIQLEAFCRQAHTPSAPSFSSSASSSGAAAAATPALANLDLIPAFRQKGAKLSTYQLNSLTTKKVKEHDAKLLINLHQPPSSTKPQSSKKHRKKYRAQQQRQVLHETFFWPKLHVQSLAVVQHMKSSMQLLLQQYMAELSR